MKFKGLNMSDREKTTLLAGLFMVLVVAFYFYMYQPTNQEMTDIKSELEAVRDKLTQIQQIANDPVGFDTQVHANREELEAIEEKLPTGGDSQELVRMVEKKAKTVNLKVVSFKPVEILDKGEYLTHKFNLDLRGNYFDIIRYCESLETLPRLVNLTGWKIQKGDKGSINASLQLEVYGGKGQSPIPPEPVDLPAQNRNPFI